MRNFLIIDGNAVGYHGQQARRLSTGDFPTQAIFHYMKELRNLRRRYPNLTALNCWDEHTQWRYDLYPEYKGKRDKYDAQKAMREEYRQQRPTIQQCLSFLGAPQVRAEEYEADDLAGYLAQKVTKNEDSFAMLVTGDQDWLQLVSDNVSWYDPIRNQLVTKSKFEEFTGFENSTQFLQAKALQGDSSDNITGVGGIGEGTAKKIMAHFGSLQTLIAEWVKSNRSFEKGDLPSELSRARTKINAFLSDKDDGIKKFKRNYKLMDLRNVKEPVGGFSSCVDLGTRDLDALANLFEELAFFSILKDFDNFVFDITGRKP